MTEWLHFHFSLSCIGEGNGNPLQCSCLENPRDGEAWWAAVSGVAQSRTRLKWHTSSLAAYDTTEGCWGDSATIHVKFNVCLCLTWIEPWLTFSNYLYSSMADSLSRFLISPLKILLLYVSVKFLGTRIKPTVWLIFRISTSRNLKLFFVR